MEKIATDTYSFEELRKDGFVYVDKTGILLPLVDKSVGKQFFLARPRRFGKSLLVSTLRCLFEGRRDLFQGLAIEPQWDWSRSWPVLHLDMGSCQAETVEDLWSNIGDCLESESIRLQVPLKDNKTVPGRFRFLVEDLAAKSPDGQIVLLVDEYDQPLLGHLSRPDVMQFRNVLKEFYSVVKTLEAKQRFTFLTGVSKFSKVSVFSGLNNLNDMTMDVRAATLLGYTHDEVKANFPESLKALGEKEGLDGAATFDKLVQWYDGYRFHHDAAPVFSPLSIGKCLSTREFNAYWFETATPTFLLSMLENDPLETDEVEVPQTILSVYEPSEPELLALLYQTGYLTIKSARQAGGVRLYRLGFPNFEVATAFSDSLTRRFSHLPARQHASLLNQMIDALRNDDVNDMLDALSCFFANIPANITMKYEKSCQSLFYSVFVLIGARTHAECWTNRGRVDAVVETDGGIYVFEFKLHGTADEALAQIRKTGYHEKYLRQGKPITLAGVAFDAEKRNLSERAIERLGV